MISLARFHVLAVLGAAFLSLGASDSAAQIAAVDTAALRFTVSIPVSGFELLDKKSTTTWKSNPWNPRFGEVTLKVDGQSRRVDLKGGDLERKGRAGSLLTFHPLTNQPSETFTVTVRPGPDAQSVELAWSATANLAVESVRLLDNVWVTDTDAGYAVVPVREGLMIPADSGVEFTHRFDTYAYEGCHLQMLGLVKNESALMVTWDDPYTAAEIKSTTTQPVGLGVKQVVGASLDLWKSAHAIQIHPLGRGNYVTLGKAYREIARQKGYLVTWDKKLAAHPDDSKLFGAINFKLWDALQRQMNSESTAEKSHQVRWTFDEAGEIAAHLKNDLQLDRVLFSMGGWIKRGYDNQHPDILPAAPECGGSEALARCAQRVRDLGYLFCLHDNYQDIYRDSPSWNEDYVMKNRDGSLTHGGSWAGGMAFLTCSQKALELAQRPQNLTAVKQLTGANAYFIDTTYASGLQECFDPKHPLTRQDDMKWKQALSDYSRQIFGVFGSECGREWAIPHADFFEGFTGVGGDYFHDTKLISSVGGVPIPLFELVYRDTIAMYGKYGYDIGNSAAYVDSQLLIGRPLNYHNIPNHLYWQNTNTISDTTPAKAGDAGMFSRANGGWADGMHRMDRFVKNTYEVFSPLNELTATQRMTSHEFLAADRKLQRTVFGEGNDRVTVTVNEGAMPANCATTLGGVVALPPNGFVVESRLFVAFCAMNWRQIPYDNPVLFTLRSLDGKPIDHSKKIRVFHGFGDSRLSMPYGDVTVTRESVLTPEK